MGYIHAVKIDNGSPYLIEPLLYATAGGTTDALTATINNFTLVEGAYVHIKINTVNALATLNVSSTGAKDIFYRGVQIGANMLTAGSIYTFIYDGTNWNVIGDIAGSNIVIGTTSDWQSRSTYIPPAGTILIYTDHGTVNDNGIVRTVPGIKIADGSAYGIDQPFVGDDVKAQILSQLNSHIEDNIRHVSSADRAYWDNKLDYDISGETLQLAPSSRS